MKKSKINILRIIKKKRFFLKTISLTLILTLFFTSMPLDGITALAEQWAEDSRLITVEKELEQYRTEFSKTYLKSDGTLESVVSSVPVHFMEDGEWVEIDSSLEADENEKGTEILKNKKGSFNVELPTEIEKDSEIAIEKGKNKISIKLLETKSSKAKKNKDKKEKAEKLTKAQRKRMTAGELFEADNNQTSAVEYNAVYNDTNVRYDVTPNEVKESIVLQKAPNKKATYSYEITADGLTAVLNKDNSIDFYEGAKTEKATPVFSMPAPHMFDSNGEYSYDIATTLENKKGKYILTYKPSYEWLKNKNRAYPVTVDPTVVVNSGIQDSYTFSGEGHRDSYTGYEQQLKVGTTAWIAPNDYWQTYLKFTDLPQIPYEDYRIDSAYLMLTPKATTGSWQEMELGVYELTEDWKNHQTGKVAERITFNNAPEDVGYSTATATVARGGADNGVGVGFEIAHIMEKWYENPEENFGIKLAAHLEENQYNDNLVFHSSRSTTGTAPYLSLTYTEYVPVTGIEITNRPENDKIFIDEALSLTITTTPENASDKADIISNVVWSSDNPDIAEIDSFTGEVIAKELGTATITATSGEYTASFTLTIREHIPDEIDLLISDEHCMFEHEQYHLSVITIYQNNSISAEVEYHSNNPEVASVSENGIITANSVGTTVITASAKENPQVATTATITVVPIQSARIVNLPENNSLDYYNNDHRLDLEITSENGTVTESDPYFGSRCAEFFDWNSSNPEVATVDQNGNVQPRSVGTTVISVSRPNGGEVLDSFTLTVYYIEATDIEIVHYPTNGILAYGEEFYLSAEISPDNASDYFTAWTEMHWESSNTDILRVDSHYGIVTAVGCGTANITVEYNGLTDTIEITVISTSVPIENVDIVIPIETMFVGTTDYIYFNLEPYNATDKRAVASSSDNSVISVEVRQDENNPSVEPQIALTAHKLGNATITVTFLSDPTKTITETVEVISSDFGITLPSDNTIYTGQTWDLSTNPNARTDPRNDGIVSVDAYGKITGVGPGTTSVEIWLGERSYFAHVEITVIQSYDLEITGIPTQQDNNGLEYNAINVGQRYEGLGVTITPALPAGAEIVWSSSDESIAEVFYDYAKGRVVLYGNSQGTVTIYAEIAGENASGCTSFNLEVVNIPVDSIRLYPRNPIADGIIYLGEKSNITTKVYPLFPICATYSTIDWKTTNNSLLNIEPQTTLIATITPKKVGTVSVYAHVEGIDSEKFKFTIKEPKVTIKNIPKNSLMYVGSSRCLGYRVSPKYAEITWSSQKQTVAKIDSNGKILAKNNGSTTITIYAKVGTYTTTDTFTLTVEDAVGGVAINNPLINNKMYSGQKCSLTATIYPILSYNQSVTWNSSDKTVASISSNGKITAHNTGFTVITATSNYDTSYSDYFVLEVSESFTEKLESDETELKNIMEELDILLDNYLNTISPPRYCGNVEITKSNKLSFNSQGQNIYKFLLEWYEKHIWPYEQKLPNWVNGANDPLKYEGTKRSAFETWAQKVYGQTTWEGIVNSLDIFAGSLYYELANFEDTTPKILNQVALGNFSEDITITGTAGQICLSFFGVDILADIRDVTYDATNWEWSWEHAGQTAIDLVALFPVIGALKCSDEMSTALKGVDSLADLTPNANAYEAVLDKLDDAVDIAKSTGNLDELAKQIDMWAKIATNPGTSNLVVLGKYIKDGFDSYEEVAKSLNATFFQLDTKHWNYLESRLKFDGMVKINQKFLKNQWDKGMDFVFTIDPKIATGYTLEEVNYLNSLGVIKYEETIEKGRKLWKAIK